MVALKASGVLGSLRDGVLGQLSGQEETDIVTKLI